MFLSNNYLNMFRASLCPPSGEQECALPHMLFCTGCAGCGCVELGRELPSVDVMFLTNLYALISSAEWSDFLTDSEGLSMSFISRSLLFLCNLSFMCVDCVVFVTFCKYRYDTTNEWCSRNNKSRHQLREIIPDVLRMSTRLLETCKVKVKQSRYRPGGTQRVRESSQIS